MIYIHFFSHSLYVGIIIPLSIRFTPSTPFAICANQALEEEIIGHSKSLYQAISLGQALRSLSSVDDKELIQAKLDGTQGGYIELQERCRMKAELLQRALANARLFGEDEVALMNWLDEVHSRLSHVSVKDYTPAILARQHADQLVEQTSSSSSVFML